MAEQIVSVEALAVLMDRANQLEVECERHRRANLVRAVIEGHDDWIVDLINAEDWDAIPWRVANKLGKELQELREGLDAEPEHFDTMHGGCCADWSVAHFCAGDIDHAGPHRCRCGVPQYDGSTDG